MTPPDEWRLGHIPVAIKLWNISFLQKNIDGVFPPRYQ